jgi:hypothetical protein
MARLGLFWYNSCAFLPGQQMTTDRRHIDLVLRIFKELVAAGTDGITPGAICTKLRQFGEPMGTWAVRRALTALEADGEVIIDEPTGTWHLADASTTGQLRGTA